MRLHAALLFLLAASSLPAAVIGTSQPAPPLTADRIATLPVKDRAVWTQYLQRSERQMKADHDALAAERRGLATFPGVPKENYGTKTMPLDRDAAWYGSPEARHIADVIVSFQIPSGGWSKNMDMAGQLRAKGQGYVTDNPSKLPSPGDLDTPKDPGWHYVGTLDNDATTTQMRFLARVQASTPGAAGNGYRTSLLRGVKYLLDAQFPNGGWPQVWPLEGGYHDAITYNDNVLSDVAELLTSVSSGAGDYAFVPAPVRQQSRNSVDRALDCILATQVTVDGKKTVWAQQHDMLTLAPVAARNYEPIALSTGESAHLLEYLMNLPHPSTRVTEAISSGIAWLKAHAIYGETMVGGRGTPEGRHLVAQAGARPIWARYYSITTGKPIFGDRDKSIHDNVDEISLERRNGYAWYGTAPQEAIQKYDAKSGGHIASIH